METKIIDNCEIAEVAHIIKGLRGTNRKVYRVSHTTSGKMLHTISLNEAYEIARLLNMYESISSFFPYEDFYE